VRRPNACLAIAQVPIAANIATAIPDGIVVLFVEPLEDTKSGPQTALTATAIHIAAMASDAHISATKSEDQPLRSVTRAGGCEIVDIGFTSFSFSSRAA
jgi:hypothetical protein